MWIGIDDTDSTKGGCTTHLALTVINKLIDKNYNIIGYPQLVRLNPNIPWKTRGNGAVSIHFGKGIGKKILFGEFANKKIYCFYEEKLDRTRNINLSNVIDILKNVFDKYAKLEDNNTNPGFIIVKERPSFELYKKAVRSIITLDEIKKLLKYYKAYYRGYKNCRGLIGATASVAWLSNYDKTYELITYRKEKLWGTKRIIDNESVREIDKKYPSTFDNYDFNNNHNRIVPNSPCPILYGIRGVNTKDLVRVKSLIKSEPVKNWIIFKTNQGTDDHLQRKNITEVKPYNSIIIEGKLTQNPRSIRGGHVIFSIGQNSMKEIDCAAYEPTKNFREIIRKLRKGDVVEVYGGVRKKPITINIEKIKIKYLAEVLEKKENPICSICGKHMKSKGREKGYKCIRCKTKSNKAVYITKKRNLKIGFYEVPVCARRHISKPLKRIIKE